MMRKTFLQSLVGLIIFAAPTFILAGQDETVARRPNFVVIVAEGHAWAGTGVKMDDRHAESGSTVLKTPNLERLATQGMRFAEGYAASPRCTPSRAALLTGVSPARLHMTYVGGGRKQQVDPSQSLLTPSHVSELPTSELTYAEMLRDAGYATAHFGKWHVGQVNPQKHGFEVNDGPNTNNGPDNEERPNRSQVGLITDKGVAFIEQSVSKDRPFLLQLDHYHTEQAGDAQPETLERWRAKGTRLSEKEIASAAALEDVDAAIGRVLVALDRLGVADNTYVIFTADHGAPGVHTNGMLAGGKGRLTEGGIRVPFIVRGPGIKAGSVANTPVVGTDILPTVAEVAGLKEHVPARVQGRSFANVFADPQAMVDRKDEPLVFHFPHYDGDPDGPASAIRQGDYMLIHHYTTDKPKLFNVVNDPGEQHDLATKEPQLAASMGQVLSKYLNDVDAQMPRANPDYDPSATPVRRSGGRGRNTRPDYRR